MTRLAKILIAKILSTMDNVELLYSKLIVSKVIGKRLFTLICTKLKLFSTMTRKNELIIVKIFKASLVIPTTMLWLRLKRKWTFKHSSKKLFLRVISWLMSFISILSSSTNLGEVQSQPSIKSTTGERDVSSHRTWRKLSRELI